MHRRDGGLAAATTGEPSTAGTRDRARERLTAHLVRPNRFVGPAANLLESHFELHTHRAAVGDRWADY